ncbi:MAG TPA: hypothetical protein VGV67_08310, partial [Solirubrobacteraceae bacterium]|nr:hypothetical protein [Solirubrobacteraceae bacterium]
MLHHREPTSRQWMSRRAVLIAVAALLMCAVAGGAVTTPVGGAARPKLTFVKAPPARTTATVAEFRFRTNARVTLCRRDTLPYRRCRLGVTYRNLRPGRHVLTVRLRHDGRTVRVRRAWTVLPRTQTQAPAPGPLAG